MKFYCDICQKPLTHSGNQKILFCPEVTEHIPDLNRCIIYHHSIISIMPDTQKINFKIVTNPPYIFEISYKDPYTIVKKIKFRQKSLSKVPINLVEDNVIEDKVLTIPASLSLPWTDKEKCLEKALFYNVFH